MSIIQGNAHTSTGGYQIERSLRFNSADSAYLNRTFSTPTAGTKWTYSTWIKKTKDPATVGHGSGHLLTTAGSGAQGFLGFGWNNNSDITFGYGGFGRRYTPALFRDPSAWYHIIVAVDTTQGTETNRAKLYVNGVQQTWTTNTAITQNDTTQINQAVQHNIGRQTGQPYESINAYLTETYFIDGQALTPSDFGETDSNTGVWKPKAYSGSYGTNGFYLKFADNSGTTATTLGKDSSGNGNNWTPNNFSVTAGTGNDSLVDTPTPYGTDTGVGGEVRGNYATFNPITGGSSTTSNGNLDGVFAPINGARVSTIAVTSGKWYAEFVATSISSGYSVIGIGAPYLKGWTTTQESNANCVIKWSHINGGTAVGSWTMPTSSLNFTYTTGDLIGVALDMTTNTVTYYKNGSNVGNFTFTTGAAGSPVEVCFLMGHSDGSVNGAGYVNFGQRPFANAAPSGFKALCTQNLPTPTIGATSTTQAGKYFNVRLYNGNGNTGQTITGVGFQPDFTWLKNRNQGGGYFHLLYDAVRGAGYNLRSDSTAAETNRTAVFSAFASDGFTFPAGQGNTIENDSVGTYASWNWKANGAGSTNTAGTITSTVSANTTSGFSIVTYTGNGTNGATIGHGLGVVPKMFITKNRDGYNSSGGFNDWSVYHVNCPVYTGGAAIDGTARQPLWLHSTAGASNGVGGFPKGPTSTVFTPNQTAYDNASGRTYVAYCFAEVAGYSAFGSFTGNNSLANGPFVYLGFRPAFLLIKRSDSTSDWFMLDNDRPTFNVIGAGNGGQLAANQTYTESTLSTYAIADLLSNGFKVRHDMTYGYWNVSGGTYIYAAFAESPFKYSLAR